MVDGKYFNCGVNGGECMIFLDNKIIIVEWGVDLGSVVSIICIDIYYRIDSFNRFYINENDFLE